MRTFPSMTNVLDMINPSRRKCGTVGQQGGQFLGLVGAEGHMLIISPK